MQVQFSTKVDNGDQIFILFTEELKNLPAPEVAVKYYTEGDLYMFGKFLA